MANMRGVSINELALELKADLGKYTSSATVPDANGNYKIVTYKREDNTTTMVSTASNPDTKLNYQKLTWQYYDVDGITVIRTVTWTITFDVNSKITNKAVTFS